jgi:hypothetical protein
MKRAGIATGYGLNDQGIGVRDAVRQEFLVLHVVQTGSGAHPASYPMDTGGSFYGVKRAGCEADHSPPTSAEAKKTWVCTAIPPYVFMV